MYIIKKTWNLEQISTFLFSLFTASTIFSVATILRNTDGSFEAYFYIAASGARHTSSSLATFTRLDVNECFYKCVLHLRCQSISFSTKKGGICELSDYRYNGETGLLFEDAEWNYYDTYDKCASNPCFIFDSCQDITEAPGFYCKCKFKYEGARCDKFNDETGDATPRGMVGKWKLNYPNGLKVTYTITADGAVTKEDNKVTKMFEQSDNQDKFPSSQGWFLVRGLFRAAVWEYVRLGKGGSLEIHHFCRDGCANEWNGVRQYCCFASGTKEDKIPQGMVGKWKLIYSNGHRDTHTITADGSVTKERNGVTQMFEKSDNQDKFPSSQGWFSLKGLFRATAWEYVRLGDDGILEIHHFCSDSGACKNEWNSVGQYCCVASGTKEVKIPRGMIGKWKLVYTTGIKVTYTIKADGAVTKEDNKVTKMFQPSDNQDKFPSSQGWFLVRYLHDDSSWEYVRLVGDGVLITYYFCEGCTGVIFDIKQYLCLGAGSEELAAPLEKNGNWILLDEKVCFEPKKKDKYGEIKMRFKVDKIGGIMLLHDEGKVTCVKDQEGTYWGCNNDKLYMFITTSDNEDGRLLPPTTVTSTISAYTLPNFNSMSTFLVLTQESSFSMEKDEELRLWHQTGLKDAGDSDDNYDGKTCAAVYADIRDDWVLQHSKVCYNVKDGYGKFRLKMSGILNGLKLVHIDEVIECGSTNTKWGCISELPVVKNNKDQRIFPFGGREDNYAVKGFTTTSPELIFKLPDHYISKEVRKGQKLRIWYGKDLNKEKVGHGRTCTAVHARLKDGMILLTPNVCFEGKSNKYGEFELAFDGHIFGIKLEHQSGKIGCNGNKETNWGCDDKVSVFITNDKNEVLFPTKYDQDDFTYSSSSVLDKEVLYIDTGKANANTYEKDDEFKVFSAEVFYEKVTSDNKGRACFQVYANITGYNKIYQDIE